MTVLSEHIWDYVIILKKNAMSLQCRYLCKFPASSILSSVVPQFSAQCGAGGTPWGQGVLSCFRWKLHPPSQAWPLLSTSNRGEIAIAKCGNCAMSNMLWSYGNRRQYNNRPWLETTDQRNIKRIGPHFPEVISKKKLSRTCHHCRHIRWIRLWQIVYTAYDQISLCVFVFAT